MGIIDSLSQLIKNFHKENSGYEITSDKEKMIKEYVRGFIENTIHRLRDSYIEIWDNNLKVLNVWDVPGESDKAEPYLREIADVFEEYYIVPTNPKGGSLSIIGKPDLYFGKPLKPDEKEKNKKYKNFIKKIDKLVRRGLLKGSREEILKKFEEICKEHSKKKNILLLLKPEKNKIGEEIRRNLENAEKIRCMLCSSIEDSAREEEISKTLKWLVTKNVTFIYDFSRDNYYNNVPICKKCIRRFLTYYSEYIDPKNSFKFLRYNFKVFPDIISDENKNIENIWSFFSGNGEESFDNIINILPQNKDILLNSNFIFLNVLIYEKEKNKVNIVDLIENIRLLDVIDLYKIFSEWKNRRGVDKRLIDEKNSIFKALIPDRKDKGKYFLELILYLLNKLLRKEKIDKNTQDKIMTIFNKLSKKYFYQNKKEKIREIIALIDFLNYYNQNLEI